jgi:hypothetical protein
LLAAFVVTGRRTPAPLVRQSIFRHRPLTGANLAIVTNAGGFGGMMFIATLYLQQGARLLRHRAQPQRLSYSRVRRTTTGTRPSYSLRS